MLPNPHDLPPQVGQFPIGILIACAVRLDLRSPPLTVPLGRCPVDGAPMPKAPVEEDGDPRSGQDDVDGPDRVRDQPAVKPEAQTQPM